MLRHFSHAAIATFLTFYCTNGEASTIIEIYLPNPIYTANLNSDNPVQSGSPFNESGTTWSVSQIVEPNPVINATGSYLPNSGTVEVTMEYSFEFIDKNNPNAMPTSILGYIKGGIDLVANGSGSASYGNFGVVDQSTGNYILNDDLTCSSANPNGCGASNINYKGDFETYTVYSMELDAEAASYYGYTSSTVDPVVSIDPNDPNSADYAVITSPGVGNTASTVPETTTWLMIFLGFAGMGAIGVWPKRSVSNAT